MSTPDSPRRGLVVIDVQNEYFDGYALPVGYPSVEVSLPNIVSALHSARQAGLPITIVRHVSPEGAAAFARGSKGAELHAAIVPQAQDHLIDKTMPSVFTGTDFADWIADHGLDTITIVGYMTQNCNVSTTIEAAHRGLNVEVLVDATGALAYENAAGRAEAEEVHRVFTVVFHARFGAVTSTARWIEAVARGEALPRGQLLASAQLGRGSA